VAARLRNYIISYNWLIASHKKTAPGFILFTNPGIVSLPVLARESG